MYLGIDFGTSGARAIVIDSDRTLQFETALSFRSIAPDQRPQQWKTTLFELIQRIPLALRSCLQRIAIDGTSATVLVCDRQGYPLHPPLMYNDSGDRAFVDELMEIVPPNHPGLNVSSSLTKLLWMETQVNLEQAQSFLHQADWLAFLLHGQLGWSDYNNSLKLGYDPTLEQYPEWFQHSRFDRVRSWLPQVVAPGTVVGGVKKAIAQKLNLPSTCVVCAGTTDSIAAFLASGANQPGDAVTSLGSTLVLKVLSHTQIDSSDYGLYSHRLGPRWLVGGASNTGGAVLNHYFSDDELTQLSHQINPHQPSSLDYYPLLTPGERFPVNNPELLPRLQPRPTDPVTFLHGLLESLARIEAQGYALLQAQGCPPITRIFTAGGGAKNNMWTAIRHRHLCVPILPPHHDQAAYGTALLAANTMQISLSST